MNADDSRMPVSLVLREGRAIVAIGITTGLVAIFALGRLVHAILYHTNPRDPIALGATVLIIAAVALVACLIPARRATKVDPMIALRAE